MHKLRTVQLLACLMLAATFIPKSMWSNASGTSERRLSGELRLVGSRSMHVLVQHWAREFKQLHPGAELKITMFGSGTAAGALAEDEADVVPLAREFTPEEQVMFAGKTVDPIAIQVGNGAYNAHEFNNAVAVYVAADNPLTGLSARQIASILSAGVPLPVWRDISPDPAGLPDCRIRPYGIDWSNGTSSFLRTRLLQGRALRSLELAAPGTRLAHSAGADPCAMGFGSPADAPPGTRLLAIRSFAGFVLPTEPEVASGAYPLARGIYLYVKARNGQPISPLAAAFVHFVLEEQGQHAIERTEFHPLSSEAIARSKARLRQIGG